MVLLLLGLHLCQLIEDRCVWHLPLLGVLGCLLSLKLLVLLLWFLFNQEWGLVGARLLGQDEVNQRLAEVLDRVMGFEIGYIIAALLDC